MTAEELFNQQMLEPVFKKWYKSRPPAIQELARKFPYDTYIVKEGAPYGVSCPGQIVHFHCYVERPFDVPGIKVIVLGIEKTPAAKYHEEFLYSLLGKNPYPFRVGFQPCSSIYFCIVSVLASPVEQTK